MFANKKLLTTMCPGDAYAHQATHTHSQPLFLRLCMILFLSLVGMESAWADETLFSTNFSDASWSNVTFSQKNTTTPDVINGITFNGKNSDNAKNFSIDNGVLKLPNNNWSTSTYFLAIPITGVNGSITITVVCNDATKKMGYYVADGVTEVSTPASTSETVKQSSGTTTTITKSGLTNTSAIVYIGRGESGFTSISSITITTPAGGSGTTPSDLAIKTGTSYVGNNNAWTPAVNATIPLSSLLTTSSTGSYSITSGTAAQINGSNLVAKSSGTVTITQRADDTYAAGNVDVVIRMGSNVVNSTSNTYTIAENDVVSDAMTVTLQDIVMTYGNDGYWSKGARESATRSYVGGQVNPSPNEGNVPTSGTYYKFVPSMNGTLNVDAKIGSGKKIYVLENGTAIAATANEQSVGQGQTLSSNYSGNITFRVTAGKTYYVYLSGSKMALYGFSFEPSTAVAPTAKFTYGQTVFPQETTMDITVPAHKAGSNLTVTLSEITADATASATGLVGNTLTITAPAAGSSSFAEVTVTDNNDASNKTVYTINVKTETKVGQTFDATKRYSQILIDAQSSKFQSGTADRPKNGLSYGSNLDYVPGLVAKAMIEAVDYYKDHKTATIDDAKLKTWFEAVNTFGAKGISQNGKDGKSFDDLNAVKINFGLKSVFASNNVTGLTDNTTRWNEQITQALTAIRTANTSYAISSSHADYPISIADMQGGWWHKSSYINQMWGDGQYMGTALLAQIINDNQFSGTAADDWNLVAKQLDIYRTYAWDNTANLPHHAFAADKGTNSTSHSDTWKMDGDTYHNEGIWARATGWYFMALIDVLEQMPKDNPNYNTIKGYLTEVAAGVKARQDDATGLWYQLPMFDETFSNADYNSSNALSGRQYNYLESSASALFTAAYFKAIRLGLLDKGTYEATAKKAYQGFVENFIDANNNIFWSCRSAGLGGSGNDYKAGGAKYRDGSNAYYLKGYDVARVAPSENLTEGKALGAFIMAATEYERAYIHDVTYVSGPEGTAPAKSEAVNTLPDVQPTDVQTGYTFNGWYKADGTKVNVGDAVTDNLTLYANYTFAGAEKFSMTVKSGQTVNATTSGQDITLTSEQITMTADATAVLHNGRSGAADGMVSNGQINLAGSGNSYLHITLPANLEVGDVINITNPGVFYLSSSDTKGSNKIEGGVYTVTSTDNFHDQKELYIWKDNDGASVFSKVTVTSPSSLVTSITLNKSKVYLEYDKSEQLSVTEILPETAANKNVTWSSTPVLKGNQDKNVVTVSNTGLVKAVDNYGGIATVTATAEDGSGTTAECTVNVYRFSETGTAKKDYQVGESGVQVQIYTSFTDDGVKLALAKADFEVSSTNTAVINPTINGFSSNKVLVDISVGEAGEADVTLTYKGNNDNYYGKTCVWHYTVTALSAEKTPTAVYGGTIEGTTITANTVAAVNAGNAQTLTLTLPAGATATMTDAGTTSATITEAGVLTYNALAVGTNQNITITITAENGTTETYTVVLSTAAAGAAIDGSIKWLDMASSGHKANTSGTATSTGITAADGKVVGLSTNGTKVINEITYSRYTGFGVTADKDNNYFEYSFNVADGYTFTPSDINIAWSPNASKSVTLDVYVGTLESNLTKLTTLSRTSDNDYREDKIDYTTPFTIVRLVPGGNNKNIILNSVVINGQVTEPAATAHTVSFNNNGHSANTAANATETEVGAGVTLPKFIPFAGYTFLGWSVDQNATKADDQLWAYMDKYYPVSDVTLYAVYRQNPIGSAHTEWWHAFSDFTKLEVNKAYTATFNLTGGSHAYYNNWALVATSNDTGHNGDGVQNGIGNELFVLRGDGDVWGDYKGTAQLYKYNGASYEAITVNGSSTAEEKATFIADMANANVKVSAARAGKKVHVYATIECETGAKYVLTHVTGTDYTGDMYLSFTTDFSSLGSFTADAESAANYLKKANDIEGGTIEKFVSLEGIEIPNGWALAEGTQFTAVVTAEDGYTFKNLTINGVDAGTGILTMPDVDATVSAVFDSEPAAQYTYTVKAVGSNNVVLNENLTSGTYTVGGAAVTVAYPQHILVDNDLYEISTKYNGSSDYYRYTFTPDADDYVVSLPYTKNKVSNVVAYVEAENISGFSSASHPSRASNGQMGYSSEAKSTGVNLPAGTYQIFIRGVNGNSATRTVRFTDGTNELATLTIENGTDIRKSSELISLNSSATLYVSCEGSSSSGLDWFYVQEVNALSVTENGQKFGFTESNLNTYKYASANGASMSSPTTRDEVTGKFYNIKNTSNYVEVTETGAIAFTVYAYHGNSKDTRNVKVYVDGEEVGTVSVTPGGVTSSVFTIPAPQNGIHTIKMTGAGSDVYVADVVFYTGKVAPSVTPANVSVSVQQEKQFTISAPDGCDITSMETVSSDVADVTYADGKITVTGKKPGNVTATFNVTSENDLFNSGTATVNITVTKADLVMKYNPDAVIIEKGASKELPAGLKIDYYVVEDGAERLLNSAPVTPNSYSTTDGTVATVDGSGNISFGSAAGGTDITAKFLGNELYSAADASLSILVKDGFEYKVSGSDGAAGPSLDNDTRKFEVKNGSEVLVYGTFGGWKRNSHLSQGASKADGWQALATYNNAIDGYSKYTSGINDAQDEDMSPSENVIYGVTRKGWFESPVTGFDSDGKPKVTKPLAPFSLPVRGTYMTFEPTKNGQLTVYILQNGAWNSSKKDVKDDDGFPVSVDENGNAIAFPQMAPWQFRPHSFYVTDQNGMPVEVYTKFDINTKQPIQSGIISEKDLDYKDSKGKYTYTETQRNMVRAYCDKYGVKLGEKFKCILDENADGYWDATNIGNWKEFKQYMSPAEQQRVYDAWNTGVNGAEKIVKLDNGSYLAVDECIMKYSFHVAAGQTYYLFSNFSKMGFSGCNFIPDETDGAQPTATLTLSETDAFTMPTHNGTEGVGNNVKGISVPQYRTITLNRNFTADNWNTICLPFTMTEKEVRDNFGDDTELIIMDKMSVEDGLGTVHFIYHEIQSILAGYPYLIKPSKDVTSGITVSNKIIDPSTTLVPFNSNKYVFTGIDGFSTANGKFTIPEGGIFISGNKLYVSKGATNLKGYRAYGKYVGEPGQYAKSIVFNYSFAGGNDDNDNVATVIDLVQMDPDALESFGIRNVATGVYNINGQKVADSVVGLSKGIYIVNGKKMVVE